MSATEEFSLFQRLPSELRLRIWGLALRVPRDVNITCDTGTFQRGTPRTAKLFRSSNRPPAVLQACHESRFEGLKLYSQVFRTDSSPRYIYVAFPQDTIKACGSIIHFLKTLELTGIQRLVLDVKDPAYFAHFGMEILKMMQPNLVELELGIQRGDVWSWNDGRDYLQKVQGDFLDAIDADPGWRWPEIRIVEAETGDLFERIVGHEAGTVEGTGGRL
jgi:hypothetical protein